MYIDTHSKASMEKSICEYLKVSLVDLYELFEIAGSEAQDGIFFNGDKFDEKIDEVLCPKTPTNKIDEVLFFHLSRRLNSTENCNLGSNLYDLLSSKNPFTDFLSKHSVEFLPYNGRLELIYNGNVVSLEDTFGAHGVHTSYLRWRLGHNPERIDYCFNGFLLKDLLYRNDYARQLYHAPEFIGNLSDFLKQKEIKADYFRNSRYYCYEYCVPLSQIFFDNAEELEDADKDKYLVKQVIHRLYDYYGHDIRYVYDHDNPIIRLTDKDTMPEEYYVSKEEINLKMLS